MSNRDNTPASSRPSRMHDPWTLVRAPRIWLWRTGLRTVGANHVAWLALGVALEAGSALAAATGALLGVLVSPLLAVALPDLSARSHLLILVSLPIALDGLAWMALDHPSPGPQMAIALGLTLLVWPLLAWSGMRMAMRGLLAGYLPFWPRVTVPEALWRSRPLPESVVREAMQFLLAPLPRVTDRGTDRDADAALLGLNPGEALEPAQVVAAHDRATAALKTPGRLVSPAERVKLLRKLARARDHLLEASKPSPGTEATPTGRASFSGEEVHDLIRSLERHGGENPNREARAATRHLLRIWAHVNPADLVAWRIREPALVLEALEGLEHLGMEACALRFGEESLCRGLDPDGPLRTWRQALVARRRARRMALTWGLMTAGLALPHALGMMPPDAERFQSENFATGSWYAEFFAPIWTCVCLFAGWLSGQRGFVSWGMDRIGMGLPEGTRESRGGCGGCLVSLSLYLLGCAFYLLTVWGGYALLVTLHGAGLALWTVGNAVTAGYPVGGWLVHGGIGGGLAWILTDLQRRRLERHRMRPVRRGRGKRVDGRSKTPGDGV